MILNQTLNGTSMYDSSAVSGGEKAMRWAAQLCPELSLRASLAVVRPHAYAEMLTIAFGVASQIFQKVGIIWVFHSDQDSKFLITGEHHGP
jgi:hypothetical protein